MTTNISNMPIGKEFVRVTPQVENGEFQNWLMYPYRALIIERKYFGEILAPISEKCGHLFNSGDEELATARVNLEINIALEKLDKEGKLLPAQDNKSKKGNPNYVVIPALIPPAVNKYPI